MHQCAVGFLFRRVMQKHQIGAVAKTKHHLISYFLSNTSAKNYHNRIVSVMIITSQRRDVFWDTVYLYGTNRKSPRHFTSVATSDWVHQKRTQRKARVIDWPVCTAGRREGDRWLRTCNRLPSILPSSATVRLSINQPVHKDTTALDRAHTSATLQWNRHGVVTPAQIFSRCAVTGFPKFSGTFHISLSTISRCANPDPNHQL